MEDFNPETNPNAIVIVKQLDGNYIGRMNKHGKVVEVRQGTPETVLTLLITHP